ncbi:MAG TPA: hypothetical protein VHG30_19410 [Microvirga sp.]|nr:hypothetical protein [Microvirga sp.]
MPNAAGESLAIAVVDAEAEDDLTAGETLTHAVLNFAGQPHLLLECMYYASEPELMSIVRAAAGLDAAGRRQVADYMIRLKEAYRRNRPQPTMADDGVNKPLRN